MNPFSISTCHCADKVTCSEKGIRFSFFNLYVQQKMHGFTPGTQRGDVTQTLLSSFLFKEALSMSTCAKTKQDSTCGISTGGPKETAHLVRVYPSISPRSFDSYLMLQGVL